MLHLNLPQRRGTKNDFQVNPAGADLVEKAGSYAEAVDGLRVTPLILGRVCPVALRFISSSDRLG